MATYTADQLSGEGIYNPTLTAGVQYTFELTVPLTLSGSGYFTMQTITDNNSYSGKPTNAIGAYADLTLIPTGGLITSSYVSSVVCTNKSGSNAIYKFTPTVTVASATSRMRSTGGISLELT